MREKVAREAERVPSAEGVEEVRVEREVRRAVDCFRAVLNWVFCMEREGVSKGGGKREEAIPF